MLICLLSSRIGFTAERETIQWMTLDWPPAFILKGELKGRGYLDIGLRELIKEMGEYERKRVM